LPTDKPAQQPNSGDLRKVGFSLRNLKIRVVEKAAAKAGAK